jgi:hypothetical protein
VRAASRRAAMSSTFRRSRPRPVAQLADIGGGPEMRTCPSPTTAYAGHRRAELVELPPQTGARPAGSAARRARPGPGRRPG